jgi:hypothetical protein
MTTLAEAWGLSRGDSGLAVVSTLRAKTTAATVVYRSKTGFRGSELRFCPLPVARWEAGCPA